MCIYHHNLVIFYFFTFWCHASYAGDVYRMDAKFAAADSSENDAILFNPSPPPSLAELSQSPNNYRDELIEQDLDYDSQAASPVIMEHRRVKRNSEPEYFTPTYCKMLGYCGLMLNLSAVCLAKCNFDRFPLLKPYIGLIPELPTYMCQTVNTIFPTLPKHVRALGFKIVNTKEYLKVLNVKAEDEADFARTSANALPVALIKNVASPDLDEFKPMVKKLEIHDTDKRKPNQLLFAGKLLNSLLSLSTGQFVNPKCDKTNLDDEAMMMIAAMKMRKCNMDLLMPGYFVFNAAHKVASTREILPLLKAWTMPLLMFTGVKCCMTQFAMHNRRTKCVMQNDILSKPHGLPSNNGPDTVCNSIPTFWPITTPKPTPRITIGPLNETTDEEGETTEPEEATTESACDDENKSELEECATENPTPEYSEEGLNEGFELLNVIVPDSTTEGNEEIESDENVY